MTSLAIGFTSALFLGSGLLLGFASKPRESRAMGGLLLYCLGALGLMAALTKGTGFLGAAGLVAGAVICTIDPVLIAMVRRLPEGQSDTDPVADCTLKPPEKRG